MVCQNASPGRFPWWEGGSRARMSAAALRPDRQRGGPGARRLPGGDRTGRWKRSRQGRCDSVPE